jgi:hypothetical protein
MILEAGMWDYRDGEGKIFLVKKARPNRRKKDYDRFRRVFCQLFKAVRPIVLYLTCGAGFAYSCHTP